MRRKELAFQPWGRKAMAEGRKTLTSRCRGLAAVNRSNPDFWVLRRMDSSNSKAMFMHLGSGQEVVCTCPWQVGVDYDGVTVTAITAKRVQNMTAKELQQEGLPAIDGVHPETVFAAIWDIRRRDVNSRHDRNPWTWRMSIRKT